VDLSNNSSDSINKLAFSMQNLVEKAIRPALYELNKAESTAIKSALSGISMQNTVNRYLENILPNVSLYEAFNMPFSQLTYSIESLKKSIVSDFNLSYDAMFLPINSPINKLEILSSVIDELPLENTTEIKEIIEKEKSKPQISLSDLINCIVLAITIITFMLSQIDSARQEQHNQQVIQQLQKQNDTLENLLQITIDEASNSPEN